MAAISNSHIKQTLLRALIILLFGTPGAFFFAEGISLLHDQQLTERSQVGWFFLASSACLGFIVPLNDGLSGNSRGVVAAEELETETEGEIVLNSDN